MDFSQFVPHDAKARAKIARYYKRAFLAPLKRLNDTYMNKLTLFALMFIPLISYSTEIDVPEGIWASLTSSEQFELSKINQVNVYDESSFGVLLDVQSLNKSTQGTNIGATLGAAYGQARYIDNAFSGNSIDYSAKNQLGAGVLGAVVGSLFDAPSQSAFENLYVVKLADNTIQRINETTKDKNFVISKGLCVLLNPLRPANQNLCNMTKESLLDFAGLAKLTPTSGLDKPPTKSVEDTAKVKCIIGNNPPLLLQKSLCVSAKGEAI